MTGWNWQKIADNKIVDFIASTLYMLFLAGLLFGVFYLIELGTELQR